MWITKFSHSDSQSLGDSGELALMNPLGYELPYRLQSTDSNPAR